MEDANVIIHEEDRKNLFKGSWKESSKEAETNKESEKRRDKTDTFKIQKRGIESKEKKFKDYDLRSKVKVQQISSYNKQKLESKEQLKLKTCIIGKEKDGQNVSRISNQRKVSRIPRPIKKESDIINQQKSVKKCYSISNQHQSAQR